MARMTIQARALTYKRQKEQSAAIRLLHADNAPVLLAIVAEHFPRGAEPRPAAQLYELMAADFAVLRDTFDLPKTPAAYCNDWVKAGWLVRKSGTKTTGETLEPSEQALNALQMMERVSAPRTAVTASRVTSISNALQALARDTDPDIESRLRQLEEERARIDAEIAQVERGEFELPSPAAVRERVGDILGQASAIPGDFARVRHESYDANRELLGLGLANIAGSVTQSFTVVGGFSRTAVNVDAGAQSPLASVLSVAVMVLALVWLAPYLAPLPYAVLGATIMVSIISMVDLATFWQARQRDRLDALAFAVALVGVLLFGLNIGLVVGILVSFAGLIWQSSHPHMAIVGQVGDTGHFRNIERHHVAQHADVLVIRIDESLFYGNAESVRQFIQTVVHAHPACRHVVLMLSAVNHIDLTAQEMLVELGQALLARNISFNFSEVKGPVMDVIANTPVIQNLSGQVFLSTQQAVDTLVALDSALGDQTLR
mgnify:CR=1 FL=1